MAPVLSQIDISNPGALAKKTNRSNVMNEYANQPIVLPVIKAHGVQFRLPKEPDLMAVNSDLIGAEKVRVDKMHPMVGAT
mmetsp:Transcript_23812/g.40539  ORF Transcript_23812/g.40539 Transcript_23812/m.40539 type:complete len:80 (-) Transcript_23812:199-438(-)